VGQEKYYHKFDELTDICLICDISKRKIPYVGDGITEEITVNLLLNIHSIK